MKISSKTTTPPPACTHPHVIRPTHIHTHTHCTICNSTQNSAFNLHCAASACTVGKQRTHHLTRTGSRSNVICAPAARRIARRCALDNGEIPSLTITTRARAARLHVHRSRRTHLTRTTHVPTTVSRSVPNATGPPAIRTRARKTERSPLAFAPRQMRAASTRNRIYMIAKRMRVARRESTIEQ